MTIFTLSQHAPGPLLNFDSNSETSQSSRFTLFYLHSHTNLFCLSSCKCIPAASMWSWPTSQPASFILKSILKLTFSSCEWSALLGTPAHLLIHAIVYSSTYVAAMQCIKSSEYILYIIYQNRGKCAQMIDGAEWSGLVSPANLLRFSQITISRVCSEWCKNIQWWADRQMKMSFWERTMQNAHTDWQKGCSNSDNAQPDY